RSIGPPGPLFGPSTCSRAHWIEDDVPKSLEEMLLRLDRFRAVAGAKEVAPANVVAIEELRVAAVQRLHAAGQIGDLALDHEVVVRAHHAEAVALPAASLADGREQTDEAVVVGVCAADRRRIDAVHRDVEHTVRDVEATYASH